MSFVHAKSILFSKLVFLNVCLDWATNTIGVLSYPFYNPITVPGYFAHTHWQIYN